MSDAQAPVASSAPVSDSSDDSNSEVVESQELFHVCNTLGQVRYTPLRLNILKTETF